MNNKLTQHVPNILETVRQFTESNTSEELYNLTQEMGSVKLISDLWEALTILTSISTVKRGTTGIYRITSPSNKVYVGQAKCIKLRWNKYKNNLAKGQTRLHNSLIKYGPEKHKFEIIEICKKEDLVARERYWQEYHDVLGEQGLNCLLVSTPSKKAVLSKEFSTKLSESSRNRVPSEKTLVTLEACRAEWNTVRTNKVKESLKGIISNWDVNTQGKVTIAKIQQLKIVGRHSVDKYYKEFKDLVAKINNF